MSNYLEILPNRNLKANQNMKFFLKSEKMSECSYACKKGKNLLSPSHEINYDGYDNAYIQWLYKHLFFFFQYLFNLETF